MSFLHVLEHALQHNGKQYRWGGETWIDYEVPNKRNAWLVYSSHKLQSTHIHTPNCRNDHEACRRILLMISPALKCKAHWFHMQIQLMLCKNPTISAAGIRRVQHFCSWSWCALQPALHKVIWRPSSLLVFKNVLSFHLPLLLGFNGFNFLGLFLQLIACAFTAIFELCILCHEMKICNYGLKSLSWCN